VSPRQRRREPLGTRAAFTGIEESTAEDWAIIGKSFVDHGKGLADTVLDHLRLLDGAPCSTTSATHSAPTTTPTSPRPARRCTAP
jgi:hypothetical protein